FPTRRSSDLHRPANHGGGRRLRCLRGRSRHVSGGHPGPGSDSSVPECRPLMFSPPFPILERSGRLMRIGGKESLLSILLFCGEGCFFAQRGQWVKGTPPEKGAEGPFDQRRTRWRPSLLQKNRTIGVGYRTFLQCGFDQGISF